MVADIENNGSELFSFNFSNGTPNSTEVSSSSVPGTPRKSVAAARRQQRKSQMNNQDNGITHPRAQVCFLIHWNCVFLSLLLI